MVAFPDVPYVKGLPRIIWSSSTSRAGKRVMAIFEFSDPFWQIDIETAPLVRPDIPGVEAFLDDAGNGLRTVLFAPTYLDPPAAYLSDPGNPALSNDGVLASGTGGMSLVINSVTNGLDLRRGDLISMVSGDYRSLHRIMTGAVAAGGAISLVVEPFVPAYIPVGAVVKFQNLELNTRVVPGSTSMTDDYLPVANFTLVEIPK